MRRREFIIILLGGAVAWPLAARAQQPAMPVIGFLNSAVAQAFTSRVAAYRRGLGEVGFVEAKNVAIEYRWANGQYDRLQSMAADLVSRRVDVITAGWTACRERRQDSDVGNPHRFHHGRRSSAGGTRSKPQPTGRQRDRRESLCSAILVPRNWDCYAICCRRRPSLQDY
jgi:hypothetical protein